MKWPHTDVGQKENHMPLSNSKVTTFPHSEEQSLRQQVTSFEEWRALAGAWPLKRLVALWNDLPGVPPVQKFTNREIALERIWRFLHPPEQMTPRSDCMSAVYSYTARGFLCTVDEKQNQDLGTLIAAQMCTIHSCFEKADEVYRRFRTCLFADPPLPQYIPREWIPISKH
jgi:hypothetical protein